MASPIWDNQDSQFVARQLRAPRDQLPWERAWKPPFSLGPGPETDRIPLLLYSLGRSEAHPEVSAQLWMEAMPKHSEPSLTHYSPQFPLAIPFHVASLPTCFMCILEFEGSLFYRLCQFVRTSPPVRCLMRASGDGLLGGLLLPCHEQCQTNIFWHMSLGQSASGPQAGLVSSRGSMQLTWACTGGLGCSVEWQPLPSLPCREAGFPLHLHYGQQLALDNLLIFTHLMGIHSKASCWAFQAKPSPFLGKHKGRKESGSWLPRQLG